MVWNWCMFLREWGIFYFTVAAQPKHLNKSTLEVQNKWTAIRLKEPWSVEMYCLTYQINVQRLNVTKWNWWKWARRPWAPANEILMQLHLELYFYRITFLAPFPISKASFHHCWGGSKPSCTTPQNRKVWNILYFFFLNMQKASKWSTNLNHFIFFNPFPTWLC